MKARIVSSLLVWLCAAAISPVANGDEIKVLVLPVSYSDCPFTYSAEDIQARAAEVEAYFSSQTKDKYSITVGPITSLQKTLSYYGANSVTVKDALFPEAVINVCAKVNPKVDFSKYNHLILYSAGPSEADGAGDDTIWPQVSTLGPQSIVLDGKIINDYGVCCEIGPDVSSLAGIGDLCHELGHLIGLKDLYDISSGSGTIGLGGTLSLMDRGNRLNGGKTPSLLSAVDLECLQKGEVQPLDAGHHILPARGESSVFLKLQKQSDDNEFFLFECRRKTGQDAFIDRDGLIVYHVDRSNNDAGWSSFQKKSLTAAQRWQYNEVNVNPDHECATLADPSKLIFWNGSTTAIAIRNVKDAEDGAVEFDAIEAIVINEFTIFQDAVILNWSSDFKPDDIVSMSVAIKGASGEWVCVSKDKFCVLIDNLTPASGYQIRICLTDSLGQEFLFDKQFMTSPIRRGTWPFIYLYGADRNGDGTFKPGTKLPLRLYNPNGVSSVRWYFEGKEISVGEDCYWHIPGSGTLRAVAIVDGGMVTLEKKINIK